MITKKHKRFLYRHMKTRIALQLVLDAMPFLLMIGFGVSIYNVFSYDLLVQGLITAGFLGFMIGAIPLFILGIKLRDDAEGEFACYPWCEWASTALRILSALGVSLAFFIDVMVLVLLVRI